MSETVRSRLIHAMLSVLLAAGLLMPLLSILDSSFFSPVLLFWIAGIVLVFELLSLKRTVAFIAAGALPVLLGIWLLATDKFAVFSDVILAIVLRFRGFSSALPLVAQPAVVCLTVLVTLLSCFACLRNVPVMQPFLLCIAMILLLYLSGFEEMIPWLLPALFSLLLMLLVYRFPDTPILPLVPFAALLVVASFLLTAGGVARNPLQDKADELRQAVLDRLFFTEPRDVFSLSSEGYYPEGQNQLGGKPELSDRPVMQVTVPGTVYLRGVILNEYTGRNWVNTTGGRRYLQQSARFSTQRSALFDEDLPSQTVRNSLCDPVTVSIRMFSDGASTLFVPQRVRELFPGGDLVPYFSNSSELFATRNLHSGDTYSVSAPLFRAGDPGLGTLIEVCSTFEDDRYEQILETYTSLPGHLEEPVYALAREAASTAVSPYDRALTLQSWLSRSFRYTLDVEDQPENVDFVTRFLLDTKEGYCTYFASAMTVLCRMIGLPARYIEGYLAEPDAGGEALVTGLSAHAWTEVYFKGFGWLTFDATPKNSSSGNGTQSDGSREPSPSPPSGLSPDETPSPEPAETNDTGDTPSPEMEEPAVTPASSEEPEDAFTPEPSDKPDEENDPDTLSSAPPEDHGVPPSDESVPSVSFTWLWLMLPLLLLLLIVLRILFTSPSFRSRHAKTEAARFDIWTQEITDLLFAENLIRNTGETPMAFGRRVDRSAMFSVALGPVGECISLIRYSRAEAAETDTGLIRDSSILLKRELSRPARLRYLLRRCFVPLRKRIWA